MSKLLARIAGYLSNRTMVGVDKVGNRYFTRTEEIDGISKWVSLFPVKFFLLELLISLDICWCFSEREKMRNIQRGGGSNLTIRYNFEVWKTSPLCYNVAFHYALPQHCVLSFWVSLVFNEPFLINWFSLISGQVQAWLLK